MRERPILFNGAMVRAILAGQKTQTRRAIKPQPFEASFLDAPGQHRPSIDEDGRLRVATSTGVHLLTCPFGQPGDRLWVRETWMPGYYHEADHEDGPKVSVIHRADNAEATVAAPSYELAEQWEREFSEDGDEAPPWRPSIHMPHWACRLVLEITAIRVERLQQITADDCLAEGVSTRFKVADAAEDLLIQWRDLWTSTGGDWDSNPWVWVIEFKRVEVAGG